jgi:hypothetical protein
MNLMVGREEAKARKTRTRTTMTTRTSAAEAGPKARTVKHRSKAVEEGRDSNGNISEHGFCLNQRQRC